MDAKRAVSLPSRSWSCDSLRAGLKSVLQDVSANMGVSDDLDAALLANLEAGSGTVAFINLWRVFATLHPGDGTDDQE